MKKLHCLVGLAFACFATYAVAFEPEGGWGGANWCRDAKSAAIAEFGRRYEDGVREGAADSFIEPVGSPSVEDRNNCRWIQVELYHRHTKQPSTNYHYFIRFTHEGKGKITAVSYGDRYPGGQLVERLY